MQWPVLCGQEDQHVIALKQKPEDYETAAIHTCLEERQHVCTQVVDEGFAVVLSLEGVRVHPLHVLEHRALASCVTMKSGQQQSYTKNRINQLTYHLRSQERALDKCAPVAPSTRA